MSDAAGLRVLQSCDWFVKYTAGLVGGLAEIGCDTIFLTRDHDLEFGDREGEMQRFVARMLGPGARHLELHGRTRDPRHFREVGRLRRAIAAWSPDVVQVQDSLANDPRLAVVSGLRRGRYALTVHDPVPHPGETVPARWVPTLRRRLREGAGLVFVHSDALADELRRTGEVSAPIEVVPHGVEAGTSSPLPDSESILFFGRQSYYKGLDVLLDAMPIVWAERPGVKLVVAGGGELPSHPLLDDPRVKLHNDHIPEEDVPVLFAESICLALPYRQASQSGVGSLARQYGRGVVATAVGGLPELVSADWGRLVPPDDPAAFAAALLEVVSDRELAAAMGRSAATSLGDASWPAVAAATVAAYRRHLL
jgi:glycosyltransferase involved in cell wall biosynthesis